MDLKLFRFYRLDTEKSNLHQHKTIVKFAVEIPSKDLLRIKGSSYRRCVDALWHHVTQ